MANTKFICGSLLSVSNVGFVRIKGVVKDYGTLLTKKVNKKFDFSKTSVTSSLPTKSGGITRISVPFTNVFKIDQNVLVAVLESLGIFVRQAFYLTL